MANNMDNLIRARRLDDMAEAYRTLAAAARCSSMVPQEQQHAARDRIKTLSILLEVAEGAPVADAVKGAA